MIDLVKLLKGDACGTCGTPHRDNLRACACDEDAPLTAAEEARAYEDGGGCVFGVQVYAEVRVPAVGPVVVTVGDFDPDFILEPEVGWTDVEAAYLHRLDNAPGVVFRVDHSATLAEFERRAVEALGEDDAPGFSTYGHPVIVCNDCGCLFVPMDDGTAYYPDRHAFVTHADDDCACHDLPYSIEHQEVP